MFAAISPERPDKHCDDQNQGQPARQTVRVFDQGFYRRRTRNDFAVAERPMRTTSRASAAGAHISAPDDDHKDVSQRAPGVLCETIEFHCRPRMMNEDV